MPSTQPGVERVAILDWDVHHGNGTQALVEA
jgi:acetoin utilization deacetylase AcuC-like enzyme